MYSFFMKIISWNVNGIRAVEKKGFVDWLLNSDADVVCIQETKASPDQLTPSLLNPGEDADDDTPLFVQSDSSTNAYHGYFSSAQKKGYSGTAIYTKIKPDLVETMGVKAFDDEGRTTIATYGKLAVISAYFPNSQGEGLRLPYKLDYCKAIFDKCNEYVSKEMNIVLCGDYNIAHKPIDLAHPKANEHNAGYLPEERAWMDFFTSNGYTDTFRHFCKDPEKYTWWSYRMHAREKNIGWRIDYQCVNDSFIGNVKSSTILSEVEGSDHCPIMIEVSNS